MYSITMYADDVCIMSMCDDDVQAGLEMLVPKVIARLCLSPHKQCVVSGCVWELLALLFL